MDNLKVILIDFKNGLFDSIIGINVIISVLKQPTNPQSKNVLKRIWQCCLLSFFLLISMFMFKFSLHVLSYSVAFVFGPPERRGLTWEYLERVLDSLFSIFWIMPLICISRIVTTFWFQDIADTSFKGRPQPFRSISQLIADLLFSVLIQMLFLAQAHLFHLFFPIGFVGELICILHISLLYSLYSFEYKWFSMGWELHRRLYYIERQWIYFFGFGLPLALITNYTSSLYLNTALFSLLFPLFILSANETTSLPASKREVTQKLPFFSLVVWASNKLLFVVQLFFRAA